MTLLTRISIIHNIVAPASNTVTSICSRACCAGLMTTSSCHAIRRGISVVHSRVANSSPRCNYNWRTGICTSATWVDISSSACSSSPVTRCTTHIWTNGRIIISRITLTFPRGSRRSYIWLCVAIISAGTLQVWSTFAGLARIGTFSACYVW